MRIVLASSSPRRKELMQYLGMPFEVIESSYEENTPSQSSDVLHFVTNAALNKAQSVCADVPEGIIIGADTVVELNTRVFGKPKNRSDAKRILELLSGKKHRVITGAAVLKRVNGTTIAIKQDAVVTFVTFKELDQETIMTYISSGEPFDKAGAYGIQGLGSKLVDKVEGCYNNVVGFPLTLIVRKIHEML